LGVFHYERKKIKLTAHKPYKVTKKIKLHTKPLREELIVKTGVFVRETTKSYIFDGFRVAKSTVIGIEETGATI
jgi:hypothetical protein